VNREDMLEQRDLLMDMLKLTNDAYSFVDAALEEDEPSPASGVIVRKLPNFVVTMDRHRLLTTVPDVPRRTCKRVELEVTISNFEWPGHCRSVIATMLFHRKEGLFLGQQVIKEDGDLLVVHEAGIPKKDGKRSNVPRGLQFGIKPIIMRHVCDTRTHEVYTELTNTTGQKFTCPSVPCRLDEIVIDGPVQVRWHQIDNHPEIPDDTREEGEWQELAAFGTTYTDGTITFIP